MKTRLLAGVAVLALGLMALSGCGDDSSSSDTSSDQAAQTQTEAPQPTDTTTTESDSGGTSDISTDLSKKPEIPKPSGDPPAELQSVDVVEGKGKEAKDGDAVTVQYVGANWSDGSEFDASWDRGEPFTFTLGAGEVIPGWDQGVKGMKEGGRRLLVIPPDLGYGPDGSPPAIPPNETLQFVVDLQKVG